MPIGPAFITGLSGKLASRVERTVIATATTSGRCSEHPKMPPAVPEWSDFDEHYPAKE
jgi:hypothetical protein